MEKGGAGEKNAAAVALGKRRQALMTPEERRAHQSAAGKAAGAVMKRRPFAERRMIALKGARTRRLRPAWMRKQAPATVAPPLSPAELEQLLDAASDAAIERLASLIARPGT